MDLPPVSLYMAIEITVEDITNAGGVGRYDGLVYFVAGAVPGDRVLVKVIERKRNFATARIAEIIEPSPHRIAHPCRYSAECGGCDWGELEPSVAREYKAKTVTDALKRIAGIEISMESVRPSRADLGYRYRVDMRPSPSGDALGFVGAGGFVAVDDCLLMHRDVAYLIPEATDNLPAFDRKPERVLLRRGASGGLIIYEFADEPGIDINALDGSETSITVKTAERLWRIRGEPYLDLPLGGGSISVYGPAFYQANWDLYQQTLDDIAQRAGYGKTFWDLYGGIGVVSYLLVDNYMSGILVESDGFALDSARINLRATSGLDIVQMDAFRFLKNYDGDIPDIVFLNPPRPGMGKKAAQSLAKLRPARIIYQSCNPATFARDCKLFVENDYELTYIVAYDFFPRTHHVEVLGELVSG
ncbi:MAG: class I SAM-dependent RNA methyltransferase [bacterium]|nr:class I SAM-dependent RNA methyltransferase [bacterium]